MQLFCVLLQATMPVPALENLRAGSRTRSFPSPLSSAALPGQVDCARTIEVSACMINLHTAVVLFAVSCLALCDPLRALAVQTSLSLQLCSVVLILVCRSPYSVL